MDAALAVLSDTEQKFGTTEYGPYVGVVLALAFLAPFVDPRRPLRAVHLDLLALLAFGVSHAFVNRGELSISAPLAYAVLPTCWFAWSRSGSGPARAASP